MLLLDGKIEKIQNTEQNVVARQYEEGKKMSKQLAHFQLLPRDSGVHAAVKSPIMSLLWSCTANVNILKLKTNSVVRHLSTAERTHRIPSRQIIVNHCTQQDKTTSRKGEVR